MEDQLNDLSVRSITSGEVENRQRKNQEMEQMENNIYENRKEIQKPTKSIETILLQRIPERDMEVQVNHENKNNGFDTQSYMVSI